MKYVKPYGRSKTVLVEGKKTRLLSRRKKGNEVETSSFDAFYASDPSFVLSRLISEFDKVAAKPRQGELPSKRQFQFRSDLGAEIWEHFKLKPWFTDKPEYWAKLWKTKLHPYGREVKDDPKTAPNRRPAKDERQGRLYKKYFGITPPDQINAASLPSMIEQELFVHGTTGAGDTPGGGVGQRGKITQHARTLSSNAHSLERVKGTAAPWEAMDLEDYKNYGDVAGEIIQALKVKKEKPKSGRSAKPFTPSPAFFASILHDHYARVFQRDEVRPGSNQEPMSIKEVKQNAAYTGLFELHEAICDFYKNAARSRNRQLDSMIVALPKNMDDLFKRLRMRRVNQSLNSMIRLGKVIHYSAASSEDEDSPRDVVKNWPSDIDNSPYWLSEGMAKIKRNEAFVRVWRTAISHAAHGLRTWVAIDGHEVDGLPVDLLLQDGREFISDFFENELFQKQAGFYFGDRAKHFGTNADEREAGLKLMAFTLSRYRNSGFHFNGRGGFVRMLKPQEDQNYQGSDVFLNILNEDVARLEERNKEVLRAVQIKTFTKQHELDKIYEEISQGRGSGTLAPRFNRVLQRVKNAWTKEKLPKDIDTKTALRLPDPRNHIDLKNPVLKAQYLALKLVYETGFRHWMTHKVGADLTPWIDQAVKRAHAAMKELNDQNDEFEIVTKIAGLVELGAEDSIEEFHDQLAEKAAAVSPLQSNYSNEQDKMSRQSSHIDDLRTDVFAIAFEDYLKEQGFEFLLTLPKERDTGLGAGAALIDDLPRVDTNPVGWDLYHGRLYAILHLIPAGTVNALAHQLRKWEVLDTRGEALHLKTLETNPEEKDATLRVRELLDLYLTMRDDKFTEGAWIDVGEELREVFDSEETMRRVFPTASAETDEHIPIRGLRELLRTGSHEVLGQIYQKHKITSRDLEKLGAFSKSNVENLHKSYGDLHADWVEKKKEFKEIEKYNDIAQQLDAYRSIRNFVQLNTHLRTYRLMMDVVGRFVDLAGMFERDVYFVMLALIYRAGGDSQNALETVFENEGKGMLKSGRVFAACSHFLEPEDKQHVVLTRLEIFFGKKFWDSGQPESEVGQVNRRPVKARNDFAHFNVLLVQENNKFKTPNLTHLMNRARDMVAYDRKLRNSLSKSISDLLAKSGLQISWNTDKHTLVDAKVSSLEINHLGGMGRTEKLNNAQFVAMVGELFAPE